MGKTYTQCQHEAINAREYPGTRQICIECDDSTGRCEDDTLSVGDHQSPLCEDCYSRLKEEDID